MAHMKNRDSNKPRRKQRQVEAEARQAGYDALTLEQKVASLKGLTASKQRAKLARAIAARNNAPKAEKPKKKDKKASVAERLAPHLAKTFGKGEKAA